MRNNNLSFGLSVAGNVAQAIQLHTTTTQLNAARAAEATLKLQLDGAYRAIRALEVSLANESARADHANACANRAGMIVANLHAQLGAAHAQLRDAHATMEAIHDQHIAEITDAAAQVAVSTLAQQRQFDAAIAVERAERDRMEARTREVETRAREGDQEIARLRARVAELEAAAPER